MGITVILPIVFNDSPKPSKNSNSVAIRLVLLAISVHSHVRLPFFDSINVGEGQCAFTSLPFSGTSFRPVEASAVMFEYDRLSLDVTERLNGNGHRAAPSSSHIPSSDPSPRASQMLEGLSRQGSSSMDVLDCGASSGYGSPGIIGTPLPSPAPNGQSLANQLHQSASMKDLKSNQFCHPPPVLNGSHSTLQSSSSMPPLPIQSTVAPVVPNKASPVAIEDGFTQDEIAQFADLLCTKKKAPPANYQCRICHQAGHYINDCPVRYNSTYQELTPYQGRRRCYGEFSCPQCFRKWTSTNSVANEAHSCIKCHIPVFPHKQLSVEKAVKLGLTKAQNLTSSNIAPIGSGRTNQNAKQKKTK
uniref:CCHC-type domain-containing protein n=1 Tax=Panagrellus redivivus TaxID=6233 RepID=A0A7E4VN90_PANRE